MGSETSMHGVKPASAAEQGEGKVQLLVPREPFSQQLTEDHGGGNDCKDAEQPVKHEVLGHARGLCKISYPVLLRDKTQGTVRS